MTIWAPPGGGYGGGLGPGGMGGGGLGFGGGGGPGGLNIPDVGGIGGSGDLLEAGATALFRKFFEPPAGGPTTPGSFTGTSGGDCPGIGSVKIAGRCVNLGDLGPGGAPAVTPTTMGNGKFAGFSAVKGMYGAGVAPKAESRVVRKCPNGWVLGDDGVCYERLARTRRAWDPGTKPLMTGGDRNAIRRAERAARALNRAQKGLKKASRALEKAC